MLVSEKILNSETNNFVLCNRTQDRFLFISLGIFDSIFVFDRAGCPSNNALIERSQNKRTFRTSYEQVTNKLRSFLISQLISFGFGVQS